MLKYLFTGIFLISLPCTFAESIFDDPPTTRPAAPANVPRNKNATATGKKTADPSVVMDICDRQIENGKLADAFKSAELLRNEVGMPRNPRLEGILARIALADRQPKEAWQFVEPYVDPPKRLDPPLIPLYLATADVLLSRNDAPRAKILYDFLATHTDSVNQVLSAQGCGRACMMSKEYGQAIESFDFASKYVATTFLSGGGSLGDEYTPLYRQLLEELKEARRQFDIQALGEDYLLFKAAESARRMEKNYAKARDLYAKTIASHSDSAFADASRMYDALCLIQLDELPAAEKAMSAVAASNSPYAGEAMLELGRIALEGKLEVAAAGALFDKLDAWIAAARQKKPQAPDVKNRTRKLIIPPQTEKIRTLWGVLKKQPIVPGELVNAATCPWYLDDLDEQNAKYLGFLAISRGDKIAGIRYFTRILELDPEAKKSEAKDEWSDYRRLKWGAEHGYLFAYPDELKLYNPQQRLIISLGDFHYVTEHNEQAIALFTRLKKGDFGRLTAAQRDYPDFAIGSALLRSGDRKGALESFAAVLARSDGTFTEPRAALAGGQLAMSLPDEKSRFEGLKLLTDLAKAKPKDEFGWQAQIVVARYYLDHHQREKGLEMLKQVPADAGPYRGIADYLTLMYTGKSVDDFGKEGKP